MKTSKRKQSIGTLRRKADELYQLAGIKQKPKSIISGVPTQVIHHFIYKSQSSFLRYDLDNGVPLTHKEHARHHLSGDPAILAKILKVNGQKWFDRLQMKRRLGFKMNKTNLKITIKRLQDTLDDLKAS